MNGFSISETARRSGVSPKRLLDWEMAGYIKPLLAKKGKRLVRYYTAALASQICAAVALIARGYQVAAAFRLAKQGPQQLTEGQPSRADSTVNNKSEAVHELQS